MKKVLSFIILLALLLSLTGCTVKVEPKAPNSFVDDDEERFILVDEWQENTSSYYTGPQHFAVIADKTTGVMYIMIAGGSHMGLTALLCEDGSPMLYDPF